MIQLEIANPGQRAAPLPELFRGEPVAFPVPAGLANASPSTASGLPKWRLRKLHQFVAENIDRRISLLEMAAAAGLSKSHFSEQFRLATGLRPHQFLLVQRVKEARRHMAETAMPLVEVAYSTGFQNQAHFSTVFKKLTGTTPARWKRENAGRQMTEASAIS